ncbi:dihydrofolate reductase family protein [Arundinibacter roseus]|uniref:Dihydrofolate reductase n=1 Tax=Arundinibacter roseus TaxID=2070510 RepID=A0A4R4KKP6_9BACT|nr:dihydrofolate reductase family protein [Arundinibacter roseus]TDB67562.1 dihydrofolate reductase [Arundinibacter roseus]
MRKLKLQVQISMDGFIAGTAGEMDWLLFNWSDDLKAYVAAITEPVDTILLGRALAEGFIPYWTAAYLGEQFVEGAKKFVETPKIVFSKSLYEASWENTTLNSGELATEINALKQLEGADMIVYGGGKFVSSLLKDQLIDELHLFINPTILGRGMPIFSEITGKQTYKLLASQSFDCGIVVLTYQST